ncbi:hypothetical protein B4135_0768 [Caldibacillus debilis]|uniref:Transposase IS204/IS1001/IS1096/IS1165 zinc-finger domain-containing protein n=1 Tax=Caldibacillus debilis TaxID=301148 RepID=A0A150M6Y9_9BACI|nr:hypothetical protein B4135_0768 [Caldibacillus debilis]
MRKIHDYRIQKIRHLKWFERPTVIFYRKRRSVRILLTYKYKRIGVHVGEGRRPPSQHLTKAPFLPGRQNRAKSLSPANRGKT